jgi:ADP-ribosylglycohydrolase
MAVNTTERREDLALQPSYAPISYTHTEKFKRQHQKQTLHINKAVQIQSSGNYWIHTMPRTLAVCTPTLSGMPADIRSFILVD